MFPYVTVCPNGGNPRNNLKILENVKVRGKKKTRLGRVT